MIGKVDPASPRTSLEKSPSCKRASYGLARGLLSIEQAPGRKDEKFEQAPEPLQSGDFSITAGRTEDSQVIAVTEEGKPQLATQQQQQLKAAASDVAPKAAEQGPAKPMAEEAQSAVQAAQAAAAPVSVQLLPRPDGSVKLVLISPCPPDTSSSQQGSAALVKQDTPVPGEIASMVEVPLGASPQRKTVLARFFSRAKSGKGLLAAPLPVVQDPSQAAAPVKARRSFRARLGSSMKKLSRSIKRSISRKDSPPIPMARHISNRRGEKHSQGCGSLESVPEAVRAEGPLTVVCEEPSPTNSSVNINVIAGGEATAVPVALQAEGEAVLPVSKARFPLTPSALSAVEVSAESGVIMGGPGVPAAAAAPALAAEAGVAGQRVSCWSMLSGCKGAGLK